MSWKGMRTMSDKLGTEADDASLASLLRAPVASRVYVPKLDAPTKGCKVCGPSWLCQGHLAMSPMDAEALLGWAGLS
jgi:hypothetical protein